MSRVKSGLAPQRRRRHKKIMKQARCYYGARSRTYRVAKQSVMRAQQYAYRDRRQRKRQFRVLWIIRINAQARRLGISYSQLMAGLNKQGIAINRKILAELAVANKDAFATLVNQAKIANNSV